MTATESVVLAETSGVGMIGVLHAAMPFPESGRCVASLLEHFRDGLLVGIESFAAGRGAVNAHSRVVATGQEFRTSRRANGTDVEMLDLRAVTCKGINVGRLQIRIAMKAQIAPALVVRENHDHVWASIGLGICDGRRRPDGKNGQRKQKASHESAHGNSPRMIVQWVR